MMAYLDALIQWGVFESVEVGFLPVGHTHCDIDQCFSNTSDRLTFNNAITLDDLHTQVSRCYNENTKVELMTKVVNWSQLCDDEKCINNIVLITQYRFFKIVLSDTSSSSRKQARRTVCHVRNVCTEDWRLLESDSGRGVKSFLRFLPDLSKTPPEIVSAPNDEADTILRIESERSRMNRHKTRAVLKMKEEVYQDREIPFHWDPSKSPELNSGAILRPNANTSSEINGHGSSNECQNNIIDSRIDHEYEIGTMVAVNTGKDNLSDSFWIGKINDLLSDDEGKVHRLRVIWYEYFNIVGSNIYNAMFRPCLLLNKDKNERNEPWFGDIDPETILVTFNSLTREKRLPTKLQTYLREHAAGKRLVPQQS